MMERLLLMLLRLSCLVCRIDSDDIYQTERPPKINAPEGFGY